MKPLFPNFPGSGEKSTKISERLSDESSEVSTRRPSLDAPRRKLKQGSSRKGIIRQRRRRLTTPRTDLSSRKRIFS